MATRRQLVRAMRHAHSYAEWREAASELDELTGASRWRRSDQSRQFDYISIRLRLDNLRSLRARHDHEGLLFALNEGIHGNVDGMGRPELYQRAKVGTKYLIEDYIEEISDALNFLASSETEGISSKEKTDFFQRADHCFGRSALMLSGSGMLAYFHVGVVRALRAEGLLPRIISGSSGGALIGSIVATHAEAELEEMLTADYLSGLVSQSGAGRRLFKRGQPFLLQADQLSEMVEQLVPDMTMQEALRFSGVNMNISVAPKETQQNSRLLNATTSPNVLIRSGVMASAALPGVFPSVTLLARDKYGDTKEYERNKKWVDGAISDDLPMRRLSRLYGVNHYIVSQTNPHIIPFVSDSKRSRSAASTIKVALSRTTREWLNASATVLRKPLSRSSKLDKATKTLLAVLNQDYIGDVNILPPFRVSNPMRLMTPLSPKEIARLIDLGERATWPKIEMIRTQTRISRVLEQVLEDAEQNQLPR